MTSTLGICLIGALTTIGCGGGGGGGDANFSRNYGEILCGAAFECRSFWPPQDGEFENYFGPSEDNCISMYAASTADADALVSEGRVDFDSAAASTCLQELRASLEGVSCPDIWDIQLPTQCVMVYSGTVESGGVCEYDEECVSNDCFGGMCD